MLLDVNYPLNIQTILLIFNTFNFDFLEHLNIFNWLIYDRMEEPNIPNEWNMRTPELDVHSLFLFNQKEAFVAIFYCLIWISVRPLLLRCCMKSPWLRGLISGDALTPIIRIFLTFYFLLAIGSMINLTVENTAEYEKICAISSMSAKAVLGILIILPALFFILLNDKTLRLRKEKKESEEEKKLREKEEDYQKRRMSRKSIRRISKRLSRKVSRSKSGRL